MSETETERDSFTLTFEYEAGETVNITVDYTDPRAALLSLYQCGDEDYLDQIAGSLMAAYAEVEGTDD